MPERRDQNVTPNPALKRERLKRGWTQEDLADGIDLLPVPPITQSTRDSLPFYDPQLPLPFANEHDFVGRGDIFARVKNHLLANAPRTLAALYGLPGMGKTALATELAYDAEILAAFRDGILWAGLGPTPNRIIGLRRWATALGMTNVESDRLSSPDALVQAIRAAIGQRRMLLVLDDAWTVDVALAFAAGGPSCSYLVTTRFPAIAGVLCHQHFARGESFPVEELDEESAQDLLAQFVPALLQEKPEASLPLVQAAGALPLALRLIRKGTCAIQPSPRGPLFLCRLLSGSALITWASQASAHSRPSPFSPQSRKASRRRPRSQFLTARSASLGTW